MRIRQLALSRYRTFEDLKIEFPNFYTAICGQNDAGKSNVIRALSLLLEDYEPYYFRRRFPSELSSESDYPKWLDESDGPICVATELEIYRDADAGLYSFLNDYLELHSDAESLILKLRMELKKEEGLPRFTIAADDRTFEGLKAEEVKNRLRTTLIVHNSTEFGYRAAYSGGLDEFSEEYGKELEAISKKASSSLKRVAKVHKEEIANLLGRLNRTYKVEITLPDISLNRLPYDLTLGDSKIDVALGEWGSGTRNRTMIFLALLRARQVSESRTTSATVTPVLVIEEPESFLDPSAQAEFGRILQDVSNEFGVQVITTTHSPYMLSRDTPASNVLLERKTYRNQVRGSQQITTNEENWMEPFSRILGLSSEEFRPWKDVFFGNNESVLLVEGSIDKEYFSMLRGPEHGDNRLNFEGTVFDYDGYGSLKNPTMLRFIKNRSKAAFITYDLDVESEVKPRLESNGFVYRQDFVGVGLNKSGMRNVEGLLPQGMVQKVNSENPELVQTAMYGGKDEKESARNRLKALYLQRFKEESTPGSEWFGELYKLAKLINQSLGAGT